MTYKLPAIASLVGLLVVVGCSQNISERPLPSSSARLEGVPVDAAFDAAATAIRGQYQIDTINRHNHVLRTAPKQYSGHESTGRLADRLSPGQRTLRKLVTLRAYTSPTGVTIVSARVEIQRYDTPVAHAFAYQQRGDDRPSYTPINESSPGGRERNDVWTFVRRDHAEEQAILESVRAQLKKTKG